MVNVDTCMFYKTNISFLTSYLFHFCWCCCLSVCWILLCVYFVAVVVVVSSGSGGVFALRYMHYFLICFLIKSFGK